MARMALTSTARHRWAHDDAQPRFVVEEGTAAPVGGEIPLPVLEQPASPAAASFRLLRHRLEHHGDPRVLAVAAAEPGGGATTCAVNLALAIAEREAERVLLVEANRSRPRLSEVFNLVGGVCFEAQLDSCVRAEDPQWRVQLGGSDYLHLLAVNPETADGKPVSPKAYRRLLTQARDEGYDYVIIDCAAVSSGGDLSLLEDLVDGLLLCALAGKTRVRNLRRVMAQLAPTPLLAVLLNRAED